MYMDTYRFRKETQELIVRNVSGIVEITRTIDPDNNNVFIEVIEDEDKEIKTHDLVRERQVLIEGNADPLLHQNRTGIYRGDGSAEFLDGTQKYYYGTDETIDGQVFTGDVVLINDSIYLDGKKWTPDILKIQEKKTKTIITKIAVPEYINIKIENSNVISDVNFESAFVKNGGSKEVILEFTRKLTYVLSGKAKLKAGARNYISGILKDNSKASTRGDITDSFVLETHDRGVVEHRGPTNCHMVIRRNASSLINIETFDQSFCKMKFDILVKK